MMNISPKEPSVSDAITRNSETCSFSGAVVLLELSLFCLPQDIVSLFLEVSVVDITFRQEIHLGI